jgi:hypothetical protein
MPEDHYRTRLDGRGHPWPRPIAAEWISAMSVDSEERARTGLKDPAGCGFESLRAHLLGF